MTTMNVLVVEGKVIVQECASLGEAHDWVETFLASKTGHCSPVYIYTLQAVAEIEKITRFTRILPDGE